MSSKFELQAPYKPAGDQPRAISELSKNLKAGQNKQTLLGVTGAGKTYVMANIIQNLQKPALIISHNKTLAAQLASEFEEFFPTNAVSYFVSYYDYYQPEAYMARTDTYIAKDASINDEVDRLRHAAMENILDRQDTIVVASVSCIYGLGSPEEYENSRIKLEPGSKLSRQDLLRELTRLQYTRNDTDLQRGTYRVKGDIIDIHPASADYIVRAELFGPQIENLHHLDALTGEELEKPRSSSIYPATFFMTDESKKKAALDNIRSELKDQVDFFTKAGKVIEAERIKQRTMYDLEMIEQLGYVSGIENYSRHLDGRQKGDPPSTLIDYYVKKYGRDGFITFIDESHMTVPQIGGMYEGDKARKTSLIQFGFRLPSAKDNRPLQFHEFEDRIGPTVFVSATPADYEKNTSQHTTELIVRPTGLIDPEIEIKPTKNQIDDVIDEIQKRIAPPDKGAGGVGSRVLVTTLTKRMAEELSNYLIEMGTKAAYLHSDVDTFERLEILRDLRLGKYDVLVGINLLREGLDLPEVSLVAIIDADKEGYLRSETSLIQTMGRGARHLDGHVIMYADKITGSMQRAIAETKRRRKIQAKYNQDNNITPQSIKKAIKDTRLAGLKRNDTELEGFDPAKIPADEKRRIIDELTKKMDLAARNLEFETAADLRDTISKLR